MVVVMMLDSRAREPQRPPPSCHRNDVICAKCETAMGTDTASSCCCILASRELAIKEIAYSEQQYWKSEGGDQ